MIKKQRQDQKAWVLSVSQAIDAIISMFRERERCKNDKVVTSSSNAGLYLTLKNSLNTFTKERYKRALSSLYFEDINELFFRAYALYLQKRGIANGNKGASSTA